MKALLIVFVSLMSIAAPSLERVRGYFEAAKTSKEATENLYESLHDYNGSDAIMLAYKGASYTLKARFTESRTEKKSLVTEGIQLLEKAVQSAPKQMEVRLVRLAVQENSPKILKYKGNITEDKQLLISSYAAQSAALQSIVKRYAQQSAVFTAAEKKKVGL